MGKQLCFAAYAKIMSKVDSTHPKCFAVTLKVSKSHFLFALISLTMVLVETRENTCSTLRYDKPFSLDLRVLH